MGFVWLIKIAADNRKDNQKEKHVMLVSKRTGKPEPLKGLDYIY